MGPLTDVPQRYATDCAFFFASISAPVPPDCPMALRLEGQKPL